MPVVQDSQGRTWSAKKVGRTSGLLGPGGGSSVQPSDIVRFSCVVDGEEMARETTVDAGVLDQMTDSELLDLLDQAHPV